MTKSSTRFGTLQVNQSTAQFTRSAMFLCIIVTLFLQHFLSHMDAVYVVVIALCRPLKPQVIYWLDFLKIHIDVEQCSVIVVGNKADLLEPKKELPESVKELCEIAREYNLQPPIILSSHDLTNVSTLKKTISKSARNILNASSRVVPAVYLSFLEGLRFSKELIVKSKFSDQVLMFFNNLGEIVFERDSRRYFLVGIIHT